MAKSIIVVSMDGAQEMSEDPPGYVSTLFPRLHIRRAKVNTLVDPGIHDVRSRICEVVVRASRLASCRVRCGD
jgi:hypothetical protein